MAEIINIIQSNDDLVDTLGNENYRTRFSTKDLIEVVVNETTNAEAKIEAIQNAGSAISIADMFEMQMRMNRLTQFSEMATNVVSAANGAISSMARNVK